MCTSSTSEWLIVIASHHARAVQYIDSPDVTWYAQMLLLEDVAAKRLATAR